MTTDPKPIGHDPEPFTPPPTPTEEDGRRALQEHLFLRAQAIRAKYENRINSETILQILADSDAMRYPASMRFSKEVLQSGEFGYPQAIGEDPSDGFIVFLHPFFQDKLGAWPPLLAYYIPTINYGEIVTADEAELFGATLLGMEIDDYYDLVCELADALIAADDYSDG